MADSKSSKTDNQRLGAKLELRRYFLAKYHQDGQPIHVFDCCQGGGVIWSRLRQEFPVASYWGLDVKPKKGRLKLDSVRVLKQPGWPQNVIDCDTYGSPWKHWEAMLPHVSRPTTVFLTCGQWQMGTDTTILEAVGLGRLAARIPPGIAAKLHGLALGWLLGLAAVHGCRIAECLEAVSFGQVHVRYFGLRLLPAGADRVA